MLRTSTLLQCRRLLCRQFSSQYNKKPPIQIPVHVAVFSLLLFPALAFTAYADRFGPTEENLEHELKERYDEKIRETHNKQDQMKLFFQHAIRKHDDGAVENQLDEVLKAGKGGKKRLYSVDNKLYGTAEGVAERQRQEEELKKQKKKRKKRKNKEAAAALEETKQKEKKETKEAGPSMMSKLSESVDKKSVVTVAVVASVAGLAGFLAGGRRSS